MTLTEEIFTTLSDADDRAGVGQFMELLRHVPGLRQWLRAVALDPMARQKFDAYLDGKITPPPNLASGRRLLGWLAGAPPGHAKNDIENLRRYKISPMNHGGLARAQIIGLVRHYQAGAIDCAAFFVMHALRRDFAERGAASPATMAATIRFLNAAVAGKRPLLLRHLAQATEFFGGQAVGTINGAQFGRSAWWKVNVLGYMLSHPKPAYRISELHRWLLSQKLNVDLADIRRFCRENGIARDSRPGRPRKRAST